MRKNQNNGAKTRKEMAAEFNFTRKTFWRKMKKHNIKLANGLVTPKEQEIIYNTFGKPKNVP